MLSGLCSWRRLSWSLPGCVIWDRPLCLWLVLILRLAPSLPSWDSFINWTSFLFVGFSLILLGHASDSSLEKGSLKVDLLKLYLSKYILILSLPLFGNLVVRLSRSEIITKNFEGIASFQSLSLPSGAGVELSRAIVVVFSFFSSLEAFKTYSLALVNWNFISNVPWCESAFVHDVPTLWDLWIWALISFFLENIIDYFIVDFLLLVFPFFFFFFLFRSTVIEMWGLLDCLSDVFILFFSYLASIWFLSF